MNNPVASMQMVQKTKVDQLPPEHAAALRKTDAMVRSFLSGFGFIIRDASRDPNYLDTHLLSYLSNEIIESAVSVVALASEGMHSVATRELRYLIEASIKICFVQQKSFSSTIEDKLSKFNAELASQRISIKKNLTLELLPDALQGQFVEEAGRLYGFASNFVHLSPQQILDSIERTKAGVSAGKERPADVESFNRFAERSMAVSLVLLFHSVPSWVAGDWFVEADETSVAWHFSASRFIAGIDSYFDCKHERQTRIEEVRAGREARVRF